MSPDEMVIMIRVLWQVYSENPDQEILDELKEITHKYEDWLFTQ